MMTHGFPNQFFIGFFQGGFNASTTETFNNQGRHIAWIIGQALGRGASAVEPSLEAQDAYVDHIREIAIDTSAFVRECTPGYFNNDGQEVANDRGELRPTVLHRRVVRLGVLRLREAAGGLAVKERFVGLDGRIAALDGWNGTESRLNFPSPIVAIQPLPTPALDHGSTPSPP